jgi:hypothetical protein
MHNTKQYGRSELFSSGGRDSDWDDPVVNPRELVDPSEKIEGPKRRRVNARRVVERSGSTAIVRPYNAPNLSGYDPFLKPPAQGLAIDTMPRPLKPPSALVRGSE